jgi:transcriptional regulator with XRE-family HTH domain
VFGMTLRDVFHDYGITQAALAQRVGMKPQYAHLLWHGQRKLGAKLAKRIHEAYGIPLTDLLFPESARAARRQRRE